MTSLRKCVGVAVKTVLNIQRRFFRPSLVCQRPELEFETVPYNGIMIDLAAVPSGISDAEFNTLLTDSILTWRQAGRSNAWIKVPLSLSRLLCVLGHHGFTYHHAEGTSATLRLWLDDSKEDTTPMFATHQVGVSGFVLREDVRQLLVVQDKHKRRPLWKFPGGLAELGEDFGETAVREVFEETGIQTEFLSILAFRQQHQHPNAFGRSDIYVICRLKPLTFDIKVCSSEIRRCEWMNLDDLRKEVTSTAPITLRLLDLMRFGMEEGFHNVDICGEEMLSVYKGLKFKIYHRPLPEKWKL